MEELFRFTLTRPADRTSATTLPLEKTTAFQREKLASAVSSSVEPPAWFAAPAARDLWTSLQQAALDFITTNLTWIVDLTNNAPSPPIPAPILALKQLEQLLADLQALQSDTQPATWLQSIQTAAANTTASDLTDWNGKLADLFLAF